MTGYSYSSPYGKMWIYTTAKGVTRINFSDTDNFSAEQKETPLHKQAGEELSEYFSGKRKGFGFPTELIGTDFQKQVWEALVSIPYGSTTTYKQLAEQVGSPKGYRAVGLANNKNPLPIVAACHRVVGADGSLTGYAYGLDMKKALLEMEAKNK